VPDEEFGIDQNESSRAKLVVNLPRCYEISLGVDNVVLHKFGLLELEHGTAKVREEMRIVESAQLDGRCVCGAWITS
jgi:hypothetical protein